MLSALSAAGLIALAASANAQVLATGANGPTNPAQPSLNTPIDQNSVSRLISLNSYDDFCLWGPDKPGDTIGDTEATQVAWCTKPRNNARVIPDGTITAVHVVHTPLYVQIQGFLDGTKLNIQDGDMGGELDPHGAEGLGNPIGGNVTTNVTGSDVFYEEWMSFMSYDMFCMRICTAENSTYSASIMCQHEIDLLGCQWVMPGDYSPDSFTTCDADPAYPPGVYPVDNGASTSTFHQRYTNTAVGNEFTIGVTVTPSAAYSVPASSNCVTHSSPANGIASLAVAGGASKSASASSAMMTSASGSSSMSGMSASSGMSTASGMSMASMTASASKSGASGSIKAAGAAATSAVASAASSAGTSSGSPVLVGGSLLTVGAALGAVAIGALAVAL